MNFAALKQHCLIALLLLSTSQGVAQHSVHIRNLWMRPQVHIAFNGYVVSFTIRDIDKTLLLLGKLNGDTTLAQSCGLDTAGSYFYELLPGTRLQYHNPLQPVLQNLVGPYLLEKGLAIVENPKHKLLTDITADATQATLPSFPMFLNFYDPKTHALLFSGEIPPNLYQKDIGLDDE